MAPKEFAQNIWRPSGVRRAPTFCTQRGMPLGRVASFARADADIAAAKTDNRIRNRIIVKRVRCSRLVLSLRIVSIIRNCSPIIDRKQRAPLPAAWPGLDSRNAAKLPARAFDFTARDKVLESSRQRPRPRSDQN